MTEYSYFWDGTVVGDARQAPYDSEVFQQTRNLLLSSQGCYILPYTGSTNAALLLGVTAGAGKTVDVAVGRAVLEGWFYENTAVANLTLDNNTSGKGRFDRIIIRLNKVLQTAVLTVVRGSPGTIPTIPAINTCADYVDCPLAYVYVPTGFAATSDTTIYDERVVANGSFHQTGKSTRNTFPNSEWLGVDGPYSIITAGALPGWNPTFVGVGLTEVASKFDNMRRGRSVILTTGNINSHTSPDILTYEPITSDFTCSVDLIVLSGVTTLTFAGVTKNVYPCSNGIQRIIFRVVTTGYTTLAIGDAIGTGQVQLGRITTNAGMTVSEPDNDYDEYIFFDYEVPPNRTGYPKSPTTTRWSTSTTLMNTDWWGSAVLSQPALLSGIKGIIIKLGARDSGSAASTTATVKILTKSSSEVLRVSLERVPNDDWRYVYGIIPAEDYVWGTNSAYQFYLDVIATGVDTTQIDLTIAGIIT